MGIVSLAERRGRILVWLVVVLTLSSGRSVSVAGPEETTRLDCGVNALFVLLRLEGRPITLERLLKALPARHPDGYSMAELSDAASSFGLRLDGVKFKKGDKTLDRPAIAFLKDEKGGHFAVLRPVGTTGTMVQVIDPPHVPWIADYDRVLVSKPWTGRILVRSDPWFLRMAIPLLLGASTFGALLIAAVRRRKSP